MDVAVAHLPPHHCSLSVVQSLPGRRALYPPGRRVESRRLPVLRLSRGRSGSPLARSGVLGPMDQDTTSNWGLSHRGGADIVGRWGGNG